MGRRRPSDRRSVDLRHRGERGRHAGGDTAARRVAVGARPDHARRPLVGGRDRGRGGPRRGRARPRPRARLVAGAARGAPGDPARDPRRPRALAGRDPARPAGRAQPARERPGGRARRCSRTCRTRSRPPPRRAQPLPPPAAAGARRAGPGCRRSPSSPARYDGHGLDVSVEADRFDDLDPQLAAAAYGIASEATTNVARHAGATRCWIAAVRHVDGYLLLTVEDDGRGVAHRRGTRCRQPVDAGAGRRAGRHASGVGRSEQGGTQVRAELPLVAVRR